MKDRICFSSAFIAAILISLTLISCSTTVNSNSNPSAIVIASPQIGFSDQKPNTATSPTPSVTPAPTQTQISLQVSSKQSVNVRQAPSLQSKIIGKLPINQLIQVIGKSPDGQWIQIPYPDLANPGWVSLTVVNLTGSTDQLRVIAAQAPITPTPEVSTTYSPPLIGGVLCADGWVSPSIGKRGACSHHKGIAGRRR